MLVFYELLGRKKVFNFLWKMQWISLHFKQCIETKTNNSAGQNHNKKGQRLNNVDSWRPNVNKMMKNKHLLSSLMFVFANTGQKGPMPCVWWVSTWCSNRHQPDEGSQQCSLTQKSTLVYSWWHFTLNNNSNLQNLALSSVRSRYWKWMAGWMDRISNSSIMAQGGM